MLREFCRFTGLTRLESILVGVQYDFRIPNGLIHKKNWKQNSNAVFSYGIGVSEFKIGVWEFKMKIINDIYLLK